MHTAAADDFSDLFITTFALIIRAISLTLLLTSGQQRDQPINARPAHVGHASTHSPVPKDHIATCQGPNRNITDG